MSRIKVKLWRFGGLSSDTWASQIYSQFERSSQGLLDCSGVSGWGRGRGHWNNNRYIRPGWESWQALPVSLQQMSTNPLLTSNIGAGPQHVKQEKKLIPHPQKYLFSVYNRTGPESPGSTCGLRTYLYHQDNVQWEEGILRVKWRNEHNYSR